MAVAHHGHLEPGETRLLQLRLHPELIKLRQSLQAAPQQKHDVVLTYVTGRGNWYNVSWKGQEDKSGGIATNIGIHLFDLLTWLFGKAGDIHLHQADPHSMAGFLELEKANVRWFLSVDPKNLPFPVSPGSKSTFRSITVDGQEIEFSEGFTDLHTRVYEETLAGRGFGITEARPSVELTHRIRHTALSPADKLAHPYLLSK